MSRASLGNPPLAHGEPSSLTVESQTNESEPLLPELAGSLLVDKSGLPSPLHLIPLPEAHQAEQPLSSPPIPKSELLNLTPESQAKHREPPVGESNPQERTALGSSPVPESEPLTRKQLGKLFKKSHETIRKWEETGELADRGWEPVPGTGSNPKNPRLYRPRSTSATK